MATPYLLTQASQRTGAPVRLVKAPVETIARRHRDGESTTNIEIVLKRTIGRDNPAADHSFVEWVIAAADRGEA